MLCHKISPFIHKMAKIYPFRGRGFHTPVEWKIGYKIINKQTIVQILIVNTAFYIYGNIRLKEISILNLFEQVQENTIAGSAFSARLGSAVVAFIPDTQVLAFSKVAKTEGEVFVAHWASQGDLEPSRATISPQSPCSLTHTHTHTHTLVHYLGYLYLLSPHHLQKPLSYNGCKWEEQNELILDY